MAPQRLSGLTEEALRLLGLRVRAARRERRWTVEQLAERVGVSHATIRKVEQGHPSVAIGTAFETAALVGVPLFHDDRSRVTLDLDRAEDRLAVLPKAVHRRRRDDDF